MEFSLLYDIVIIFAFSVIIIFLFHKIKLPAIIGFLLTGILIGPYGLSLVSSVHDVEILAEIGILLLLFTIGIEFSFKEMLQLRKAVLAGGSIQVMFTIGIVFLMAFLFTTNTSSQVFIGFLVALSSTAIVLKIYNERGEIESPHGRTVLAFLIFQDIIVVPMMLLIPILAGKSGNVLESILLLILKGVLVLLLVFVSTKYLVPNALFQIAKTRNRELFLLSIIVICFGIVWITSSIGLSLALGAFLAGLIISESEYSHQALGNILPFRDAFTSLFFVSIGMLLDISFFFEEIVLVIILSISVLVIKSIIAGAATLVIGYPLRTAIIAGLGLSQIGEFSFILAKSGYDFQLIDQNIYQLFLSVSILTMGLTPFIANFAHTAAEKITSIKKLKKYNSDIYLSAPAQIPKLDDHLVIIGFGINGTNLARAARAADIKYIIIEMNPDTVKKELINGEPIFYGDASYEEVLHHANIDKARIAVVAINDPVAVQRIVINIKSVNPNVYLIARTRYVKEISTLMNLGADDVIPEEFETSVEIFTRVLLKYLVPKNEIDKFVEKIREAGYKMLRSEAKNIQPFSDLKLHFPGLEITSFCVLRDSILIGKSLNEIDFRNKYGGTILAVKRENQFIHNPSADFVLMEQDTLFTISKHEDVVKLSLLFQHEQNYDEDNN
ncbi:MAG: cation:proton antiporter [Melioribacteraceae bacterium]|nr:cation:proton antiporter [Melioribacteraceae bacterium]MCF8355241.1 cation:proton antiporter [Melioribacteraceae bacterium]MCF8395228.1 cation:proton antiporter [Melioribacteraceae bacterium]MCF8420702.1 cation:proton antiporter [Melioribacteraceae bacterium]